MRSRKEKEMGGVIVSIFAVAFLPKWLLKNPEKVGLEFQSEMLKSMSHSRSLFRLFLVFFKQTFQFLQLLNEKNIWLH